MMNIREFRELTDTALRNEGLQEQRLFLRGRKAWSLPSADIVRFFMPSAHRRPWGFILDGGVGIEIPALRDWLCLHKPGEETGIFWGHFVLYLIANEDGLSRFWANDGDSVPADLWAALLKDRLLQIPSSLDELLSTYRRNREVLGWLAHPSQKPAWDFLLRWNEDPDPKLHVPRMTPTGQIV